MSLRPAAAATPPARQRGEYVVDQGLLRQLRPALPHGHNNSNRYHKRNVRDGVNKETRLEGIEEALREKIGVIAREIVDHPERFRAIESVKGLLIEEVD